MTVTSEITTITFTPTLYVFLGSSPAEIGWRLKKLQVDGYGDIPIFQHLWIDTDSRTTPNIDDWLDYKSTVRKVNIGNVDTTQILENLSDFPSIQAWWPKSRQDDPGTLSDGAKQIRINGRLGFFASFMRTDEKGGEPLRDALQNAAQSVVGITKAQITQSMTEAGKKYQINDNQVRVFVVNSMCGGTGSGIAFDVAYLLREFFARTKSKVSIIGVQLLPPIFENAIGSTDPSQKEKVKANGYSYLQDLDYSIVKRHWNVKYPTLNIDLKAPPFDYVYVVDRANKIGQYLDETEDVYKMSAQALFLLSVTPISASQISSLVNTAVYETRFKGKLPYLNSFGASSLIFPKERLLRYCSNRLTIDLIQEVNNDTEDGKEVRASHKVLLDQLGLKPTLLADNIQNGKGVINDHLELIQIAKDPGEALVYITKELDDDKTELGKLEDELSTLSIETGKSLIEQLHEKIYAINAVYGPNFAKSVTDSLNKGSSSDSLESYNKQISEEEEIWQKTLKNAQKDLDDAKSNLSELSKKFTETVFKWLLKREWTSRFETLKTDVVSSMSKVNEARVRIHVYKLLKKIYVNLATEASDISLTLEKFAKQLTEIQSGLQREVKLLLSSSSNAELFELSKEIVDIQYFQDYYEDRKKSINIKGVFTDFIKNRESKSFEDLATFKLSNLSEVLLAAAKKSFKQSLENVSVLEEMLRHYGPAEFPKKIEAEFDSMIKYCLPFWRYNYLSEQLLPMSPAYIGVEDAQSSLIPDAYKTRSDITLVSTGIKDAIFFTRSEHGIPVWMLTEVPVWRQANNQYRSNGGIDPINIISQAAKNDIDPESSQSTAEIWALALAFGYVTRRSSFYYYDENKQYINEKVKPSKADKISQGRGNAESAFSANHVWVNGARELINKHIKSAGAEAAVCELKEYKATLDNEAKLLDEEGSTRTQLEKEIVNLEIAISQIEAGGFY